MSLLEHPEAQVLLEDACVTADTVRSCRGRLTRFLKRYLPWFYRKEQRKLAQVVIQGKLSNLERKTSEPIANQAGQPRKPVQKFVGAGKWDDEAVMRQLRRHVAEELGDPDGILVVDNSGFAKKGTESCGVARQWCGRLGKLDNCQVGVFLTYAAAGGHAPLDRQLYLTEDWAEDGKRRHKTYVPEGVVFQEKWRIALDLVDRSGPAVPHRWVTADDEFGRVTDFRAGLRLRNKQYVLDVPCNTLIREIGGGKPGPWLRMDVWAARQPAWRWKTITVRDGAQGPLRYRALKRRVQTRDAGGLTGPAETAIVIRTMQGEPQTTYALGHAPRKEKLAKLVGVERRRHDVEEMLQEGKGEVGLGHYEVRSWTGWHHHMTLSMLALWFLILEKRRVGEKKSGHDRAADPGDIQSAAATASAVAGRDRRTSDARAAA